MQEIVQTSRSHPQTYIDTNVNTDWGCDFHLVSFGRHNMCLIYKFIEHFSMNL